MKSVVFVKDHTDDAKDRLVWKWLKGTTTLAQIGDPVSGGESYAVCLYDGTDTLLLQQQVLPGGACNGRPCWKALRAGGYRYRNRATNSDGVLLLKMKEGTDRAKVLVRGKGVNLSPPSVPVTQPVTVWTHGTYAYMGAAVGNKPNAKDRAGAQFQGDIDDVEIIGRALSAQELQIE